MIELQLIYDGGGKFSPASHVDFRTACEELEQGERVVARLVRPRSSPENRLFHGAMKSAWDNQRGGPLFTEEEGGWLRLRAWCLCEAGWCDLHEFDAGAISKEAVAILKQRDQTAFWTVNRGTGKIRVRFPKSISFKACKHPDFQPVKGKVFDLLCNVICPGTTPEELMEIRYSRPKLGRKRSKSAASPAAGGDGSDETASPNASC